MVFDSTIIHTVFISARFSGLANFPSVLIDAWPLDVIIHDSCWNCLEPTGTAPVAAQWQGL